MDIETKKLVDKGDFRTLKYLFVDALDVDPTFAQFEDDYRYCRQYVPQLWDSYQELTPLRSDPKEWDEEYWVRLKVDLAKNFADKRLSHMREVAKVVLAEKVRRIQAERAARTAAEQAKIKASILASTPEEASGKTLQKAAGPALSGAEQERRRIAAKERQLAEENRRLEEARAEAAKELAAKKENLRQESEETPSKKCSGLLWPWW